MKRVRTYVFSMVCLLCMLMGTPILVQALEIGVVWLGSSSMTERVEKAFGEEIQKLVPDVKIEYQHVDKLEKTKSEQEVLRSKELDILNPLVRF